MDKKGMIKLLAMIFLCFLIPNLVSSYEWNETLEEGLQFYHDFNSTTDSVTGAYNLTNNQGSVSYNESNCKIGKCAQVYIDNNLLLTGGSALNIKQEITINFWARMTNAKITLTPMLDEVTSTAFLAVGDNSVQKFYTNGLYVGTSYTSTHAWDDDVWHMVTYVRNSSGWGQIYINASLIKEGQSNWGTVGTYWYLGTSHLNNTHMEGQFDEMSVYNRSLSQSEILQHYNNEQGLTYGLPPSDTNPPSVTINTPLNQTYSTTSIVFNITSTDETLVDTCLYSLDSGVTNITMLNTTTLSNYNATNSSMTEGSHKANFYCNDSLGYLNNSESVSFDIGLLYPIFSDYYDNNDTFVNAGTGLFNVTILNSNGTAGITFNNTNFTADNLTYVYNASFGVTNGTFSYYWWSYGNGTDTLYNVSQTRTYAVNYTDYDYPIFSTYYDNNGSLEETGTGLFNVTVTSTNNTVILYINNTNITATQIGDVFNVSYDFTSGGNYTYYWLSYGNGTNANFNKSAVRVYSVNSTIADAIPPQITINTPLNDTYNIKSITFNITATDNILMDSCWATIDNGATNLTLLNSTTLNDYNATNSSVPDGSYTARFYCNDSLNNINDSESVDFTVLTPKIDIEVIYPLTDVNVTQNEFFNVTIKVTCRDANCGEINVSLDPFSGSGSGTVSDPYQITSWAQLNETHDNLSASYILMNNLDSSSDGYDVYASSLANGGKGWVPIGKGYSAPFSGSFNGNRYNISDLYISRDVAYVTVGMFGYTATGSILNSISLLNISYYPFSTFDIAGYYAGGLVGENYGDIRNCYVEGTINLTSLYSNMTRVGGLAGLLNSGNISGSYVNISILSGDNTVEIGGLSARIGTTVEDCYATGRIDLGGLTGGVGRGGFVANVGSTGKVNRSYSNVFVSNGDGFGGSPFGGLVENSFWDNETSNQSSSEAGIGKTTSQMKDINTFTDSGWSIASISSYSSETWYINNGNDYPKLGWEYSFLKSGLVSTTEGDTPFYTNESNPRNITLNKDESQEIVFWVNATGTLDTTHLFYAYANLTSDLSISNITTQWNVTIQSGLDTDYPTFSNFLFSITNNTEYTEAETYQFNATISSTNGTAGIDFNNANYSLSNLSDSFYSTISDLGAGTYNYYMWALGNGTDNLFNKTIVKSYTIAQNSSLTLGISGTSPITYGATTDVAGTGCPTQLTCSLDKSNQVYGAGSEVFNYSTAGNTNYTATSTTINITINKAIPQATLNNITSRELEYPNPFNFTYSESNTGDADLTYSIFRDGEDATSEQGLNVILGVGAYDYILNTTGGANYTLNSSMNNFTVTIQQNSSYSLTLTGTSPITYGIASDFEGSACPSELTCNLTRNDTGTIDNPDTAVLSAGFYNYTFNTSGNTNYSYKEVSDILQVNKNSSLVHTFLNNSRDNITIYTGTTIWLNGTLITGEGIIYLYNNGTLINQGASPLSNSTIFNDAGMHNITTIHKATQNYTTGFETWWVNVTQAPDTTPPYFTSIPSNEAITYGTSWRGAYFNATDETGFDSFSINDTTNFQINSSGFLNWTSQLAVGTYYINITINDTSNNVNSTVYNLNITKGTLSGSLTNTEPWTVTYGTEVTIGLSESNSGDDDVEYDVFRDEVDIGTGETATLQYGTYNYILNSTGGANWTENSSIDAQALTITQNLGNCQMLFNETSPKAYNYLFQAYSDCTSEFTIYRNETITANNSVHNLGAGYHNFTVLRNDTFNYSNTADESIFQITRASSSVNLTLNNTQSGIAIAQGGIIDLNCSVISGEGIIRLYRNGTLINSGISPLYNSTQFNFTLNENITCIYPVSENYSASSQEFSVNAGAVDISAPLVYLINPPDGSEDTDTIVNFQYNVSDDSNVTNCSLYFDDILSRIDISITKDITQEFLVNNPPEKDSMKWHINCTDEYNYLGNSSKWSIDTKLGGSSTSGGGGGTASDYAQILGLGKISFELCNLTYESAKKETSKYTEINSIIEENNLEEKWTEVRTYIDEWQGLCSDLVNRTLREETVCEKIYYFILKNNYNYSLDEIYKLKEDLKSEVLISTDLLEYYIKNHYDLCYLEGHSEKLPGKKYEKIVVNRTFLEFPNCSVETGNTFFDLSIPFFEIYIGKDLSCSRIEILRVIIDMEERSENYYFSGLKLWWILLILALLIIYFSARGANMIKKIKRNQLS